ncbi:phage tail protein [Pannonibacter tanglangensis]|uniref:Phage tail protein n=1 Tax=Pannonibacter tanglangensis TaxID=2750084 RepID=A0ABW9ZFD5_9HYPH|nr:phage tail protein [Pannonibacter sp. XCT-34]NBN62773.1 phage tail protein [Pannonibacter sp. XCT-34]
MAGPVPMMLGPFAFEGLGFGFDGVTRRLDTSHAEVPLAGGLNEVQWTGATSDTVVIKGVLFADLGGQESLDGLIEAANSGTALMAVSGTAAAGLIAGYYVVEGIDEDRSYHDAAGQARRNAYQIRLRRKAVGPFALGLSPLNRLLDVL